MSDNTSPNPGEAEQFPPIGRDDPGNGLRLVLEAVDQVQARLDATIDHHYDGLYLLMGTLPNATRRLMTEQQSSTAVDHCAIFLTSRLFNHLTAAFILMRRGLIVDAVGALRSALETSTQAIVFLYDPNAAEAWLNGKKFTPGRIRKKLKSNGALVQTLYGTLSNIAHANPEARWAHSGPAAGSYAINYGGSYRPKNVATLLAISMEIILVYMTEFHAHYKTKLSVHYWPFMIEIGHRCVTELNRWKDSLSHDWDELAQHAPKWVPEPTPEVVPPEYRQKFLRVAEQLRIERLAAGPTLNLYLRRPPRPTNPRRPRWPLYPETDPAAPSRSRERFGGGHALSGHPQERPPLHAQRAPRPARLCLPRRQVRRARGQRQPAQA